MPFPEVQDPMGGSISVPVLLFETWGAFEPSGSDEFEEAHKRWSETTTVFRIPYPDYALDPRRDEVVMAFDEEISPPNISTWNVLGSFGDRFETLVAAREKAR